MAVDSYLRRAQEALDAAKLKAKTYRGDCLDCIHRRKGFFDDDTCAHPAVQLVVFNVTDDVGKRHIMRCGEQRDRKSLWGPVVCGPDGALFDDGKAPAVVPRKLEPMLPALAAPEPAQPRRSLIEWLHDLFIGKPA